jgi:hypothetical protein
MIAGLFSPNTLEGIMIVGGVATLALVTIFIAEFLDEYISKWKTYPVLIIVGVVGIICLALARPLPVFWATALRWQAVVVILVTLVFLTAEYRINTLKKPPFWTWVSLTAVAIVVFLLYWFLIA